ncbi:uncharacterized protein BDR25DRAFT_304254 [Lindgomyces ingoldianus]|uniref:Uncharacterized protein n=1 Tax=Lindgomyces ingoldianus TaxID=673940 RepID=A0ACB6QS48_9PLEO|nr:uncharacterized protein BDR25DRAFT_304254 [Lindgomyces ingoldianus]KAF2469849.1 hypothetical protein BDR25DRAFT_304254 [Lindgomyces ingoldianus]
MPTPKLQFLKSNRSRSSVDSSSGHASPVPSVNNEASAQRYSSPEGPQQPSQNQPPQGQHIPQGVPQGPYRQAFPARTTSHRHSSNLSVDHPPQNLPGGQLPVNPGQPSPGIDQPRRSSYQPQSNTAYVQQEPKKQSFRSRIAAGFSGHKDEDPSRSHVNKNGLGRRVSVRKSDGRPESFQSLGNERLQAQQWSQPQGSSPHLPTSTEQDEDNLDPFLQQEGRTPPEVPSKDLQYQAQHPQQFVSNHNQEQYNRPPLARVNTEGSFHTQGGVDHYSPEQHQGIQQQHPQQQQQYQSYSPPTQQPQNPHEYQAFHPQNVPSPHLANTQLHPQGIAQQQQNYYQYQQQQQQQQPQPQTQTQTQTQQQSPQDHQPQNLVYPPPQQFASPQPQQGGQEFQHQQVQHARPTSQHQPELQHPQATHQIPQIIQQGQQIDTQHLQQLRPASSQAPLPPPSPLQPLQPPPYQAYDNQQSQPNQGTEPHSQNITPPQEGQQGQDNMAPPASQQRNTLRKVNDSGQPQPGAPSRESSLLQQPPVQGQAQGQPPVSPGIPTFGANVVPTASQGQPYRGEKPGQPGQGGEIGRATPPPRSASDMSDEEVHQLLKDHEVLREKYQKVKRYFFEQQSQVHQLQNTLAHQRLSLSRTSWDDSEYATRFNRLDGLVAQLSFAIRKDWKSIPPWLQPVVNKNAVETGKQEMTAVGRAFISSWIVENIFDKYFHPDLEPGFSTQLKLIQLNIRRFSPTCQTSEDEDALVAKTINWRLATLEGIAELLRSPQSPTNRQNLTETLNEKLIGSLQMFLNDPAPPDLSGGVPMIVELAVNIAQHLPLESREVHIEYFPPGHSLVSEFMKMESGIPALTSPIMDPEDADRASLRSVASELKDSTNELESAQQAQQAQQTSQAPSKEPADKKRGMFGFGGSKKPTATPAQLGKRESSLGQGGSQQSLTQPPPGSSSGGKEEPPPPRVRMAVGVAVQIRGKSILMKAPVYST